MIIESTQIITNFDKKIQYINLELEEELDEGYNATATIINSNNFSIYLYFGYSKYEQPQWNIETSITIQNPNNKYTELQLYGSNGFNYIFYTNTIEYLGKKYYLLDIQNLKIENETTGDRFDFLDMSRGFKSDILNYGTHNWTNEGINYYNDVYSIDTLTLNNLSIANNIQHINYYKKTGTNLFQTFTDPDNTNTNILIYESIGTLNKYSTMKKIDNIYSLNDTSFNYQYNDYITKTTHGIINETWYEQSLIINNDKTKTSNYANSGLRNIMTQNEVIDLNYNDYINFEGQLSTELVLLPVEVSPEQNLNLDIFTSLENIPITATMTLGAVFSVPIVILFFMMIKRIAGV